MQDLSTCLGFDRQAEEAVAFYCGLFPNSRLLETKRHPQGAPRPAGSVPTTRFTLHGTEYGALDTADAAASQRAFAAMMTMTRIDSAAVQRADDGGAQ